MPSSSLRDSLEGILSAYKISASTEPFSTNSQVASLFESARNAILEMLSEVKGETLEVSYSYGKGNWATIPWIAIFDKRETSTAQKGVYIVFLFRGDMSGVYLTFNQGVTEPKKELGSKEARIWLRKNATSLQRLCEELRNRGFEFDGIDLRIDHGLGKDYEASTVAYKLYPKGSVPQDEDLRKDIFACLKVYERYINSKGIQVNTNLREVCEAFAEALKVSNLYFGNNHLLIVRTFIASLATKRFVILSGLSGSGKTQIALRFGDWIGGHEYAELIPVRPDWTGAEAIFGYEDALIPPSQDGRRAWHVPRPLEFILRAAENQDHPYLLILDEMNLAYVERYFADMLSGMETDYPCLPNLKKEDGDSYWRIPAKAEKRIPIPSNLFVVGTVNIDETTYMFSPKVLDRANTIEFRVSSDDLQSNIRRPKRCEPAEKRIIQAFLAVAKDPEWHVYNRTPHLDLFLEYFRKIHKILSKYAMEYGHRTFVEAARFACILYACGEEDVMTALDLQIMQKILPRFHGSRQRLEPPLLDLARFCYEPDLLNIEISKDDFDPEEVDPIKSKLPLSFSKIQRMIRILRVKQFVSFSE